jgi:hypothetical protein
MSKTLLLALTLALGAAALHAQSVVPTFKHNGSHWIQINKPPPAPAPKFNIRAWH